MRLGGAPKPAADPKPTLLDKPLEPTAVSEPVSPVVAPTRVASSVPVPHSSAPVRKVKADDSPPPESSGSSPAHLNDPANKPKPAVPDKNSNQTKLASSDGSDNVPPTTPGKVIGNDFENIDELIQVGEMKAREEVPSDPIPVAATPLVDEAALPLAETLDSSPILESLEVIEDAIDRASITNQDSGEDGSFEVLDDSEEDVIDLSDGDIVVAVAPTTPAGANFGSMPVAPVAPAPIAPVAAVPVAAIPVQPVVAAPVAVSTPAIDVPGQPAPTSVNPAYKAFGPPPPAHYPNEPPVPDSASRESAVGGKAGMAGYRGVANKQGGATPEVIFTLIISFLATLFGLWVAIKSYGVVSWFMPGSVFAPGQLSGSAAMLAFIFGLRLLAGLGLLVGGCLFFINEIMRLNRSDPMPYSCIIALIAGCCFLLVEVGVMSYSMFNMATVSAYGIGVGTSIFLVLLGTFFRSLIPIGLIIFAALRQR